MIQTFLLTLFFSLSSALLAEGNQPLKLQQIEKQKEYYEKWVKEVGQDELIKIGKMRQRPHEINYLLVYYPYLLPEKFFGLNSSIDCYTHLDKYIKSKDSSQYIQWKECWKEAYAGNLPKFHQRAIEALK